MVWGGALRIAWVYHITWFVNSASHCWGYQSYNTGMALADVIVHGVVLPQAHLLQHRASIHGSVHALCLLCCKHVRSLCTVAVSLPSNALLAHLGRKLFAIAGDLSRNNWWVAALAFGEGWHNNHHAFEFSARHGLEKWQIDITWLVISALQKVGLATNVKLPSERQKSRLAFE